MGRKKGPITVAQISFIILCQKFLRFVTDIISNKLCATVIRCTIEDQRSHNRSSELFYYSLCYKFNTIFSNKLCATII